MSVPLSSIGAPPEDNAQPANEAAVTGSDSRWGAEGHRHQMVKVNHRVCNSEQNFNLQRAFIQVTGGERQHAASHRGLVIWSWQVAAPKEQPETHKTNSLTPSPGQMFKEIQLRVLIWGESRPPMCGVWKYPVAIKDTRCQIGSRKAANISLHICPRMCYTYPVEVFIYFLPLHLAFKLLLLLQDMFGSLLFKKKMPSCIIYLQASLFTHSHFFNR